MTNSRDTELAHCDRRHHSRRLRAAAGHLLSTWLCDTSDVSLFLPSTLSHSPASPSVALSAPNCQGESSPSASSEPQPASYPTPKPINLLRNLAFMKSQVAVAESMYQSRRQSPRGSLRIRATRALQLRTTRRARPRVCLARPHEDLQIDRQAEYQGADPWQCCRVLERRNSPRVPLLSFRSPPPEPSGLSALS